MWSFIRLFECICIRSMVIVPIMQSFRWRRATVMYLMQNDTSGEKFKSNHWLRSLTADIYQNDSIPLSLTIHIYIKLAFALSERQAYRTRSTITNRGVIIYSHLTSLRSRLLPLQKRVATKPCKHLWSKCRHSGDMCLKWWKTFSAHDQNFHALHWIFNWPLCETYYHVYARLTLLI